VYHKSEIRAKRGDIVECTYRYYNTISYGETFRVTDTTAGGSKIKIKPEGGRWCSYDNIWYMAKNFKLISRPDDVKETTVNTTSAPANFVVLNSDGQKKVFADYESMNKWLREVLTNAPGSKYHIYAYQNTAQTKPVDIDFVDAREPVVEVVTSE
jgi:hypothetical protein